MRKSLQLMWRFLLALTLCISVVACSNAKKTSAVNENSQGYRPFTKQQKTMVYRLRKADVSVIKQGDRLTLVIPTDRFFEPRSTDFKRQYKSLMRLLAHFCKSYAVRFKHPKIAVRGFTDRVFGRKSRRELSRQYALAVASYLWSVGVSPRSLQVKGYGSSKPVGDNTNTEGAYYNRRVEIIFK